MCTRRYAGKISIITDKGIVAALPTNRYSKGTHPISHTLNRLRPWFKGKSLHCEIKSDRCEQRARYRVPYAVIAANLWGPRPVISVGRYCCAIRIWHNGSAGWLVGPNYPASISGPAYSLPAAPTFWHMIVRACGATLFDFSWRNYRLSSNTGATKT